MRREYYNVYKFGELSPEQKQKAIDKWYALENHPFLEGDLTESCKAELEERGISYGESLELHYSLGYCQGDGLCFTGAFSFRTAENTDLYHVKITHCGRYYHSKSVDFEFTDADGEMIDDNEVFIELYRSICRDLEKEGYGIIEYRMSFEEFEEHAEVNGYEFTEDGKIV